MKDIMKADLQNKRILKKDKIIYPPGVFDNIKYQIYVWYTIYQTSTGDSIIEFYFSFDSEVIQMDYRDFIKKLGPELYKSFRTLINRII